ncbi:type I restriction modification DNA specificity domain protein [mine drainage metagenome]|uniref:Type I restriction modification DNA specificity domain protein n=1 Tax=mine drainage metagenome TaxID=410659 RepID=A0A1J5RZT3_9ZZZZ
MTIMRLGDICEFKYGSALPERSRVPGATPVYGSNGEVGTHNQSYTDGPAIIVGRKGSIGEVNYSPDPCWPIDTTYYIDQSATEHNLRWLAYALSGLDLGQLNKATGVPGLNRNDAYEKTLHVPSLEEQRRIAVILDQANDLRRKRVESIRQIDRLIEADFSSSFVEDASPNWPEVAIEDVCFSIRTGPFGSQLLHSEFVESGVAVLGIDNAVRNEFAWDERRYITEEKFRKLSRFRVFPNDVIITIMGTCGRAAVVPDTIPVAITTKHLCCLTLDATRCLPEFLHACFLLSPTVLRQLGVSARGAVMPGLNMGLIKKTRFQLPPIDLQRAFVARTRKINGLKTDCLRHLTKLDELFFSLQHRAFRGEL